MTQTSVGKYLTPSDQHWACDIEADGLLDEATRIWCATACNVITKEEKEFRNADEFQAFRRDYPEAILVGHNFLAYDAVMLNRFWGARIKVSHIVDTFLLSQVYNPSYPKPKGCKKGTHSLEAWGIRLRYPKGDFDDFSCFTPEMLRYCRRDTRLTALLFLKLSERMRDVGFTETGLEIEHLAWNIIQNKQKRNGFPFDYQKAHELYVTLRSREEELKNEIYKLWPPELRCVASRSQAWKKDGGPTKKYAEDLSRFPKLEVRPDGSYDVFDYVEFNLGSPPQRIAKLLELGWKPTNLTKAGNPKVDEDELLAFAEVNGTPELKALAKWIVCNARANNINTWMEAYNDKTGAIHGQLFIASTLRYKHSSPNSANIPGVRTKKAEDGTEYIAYGEEGAWTYESRDLWTSGDTGSGEWTLVGIDGTGIQNRCLIHHLIRVVGAERVQPFKELALEGDIHKRNIEVLGLANKPAAKKFYYTLMMGGGGGRLAADQAQFGTIMTAKEGAEKKKALIATIPGFGDLIKSLENDLNEKGRITLCDGTPVLVPSPHMVIPYLLQGDESRLMKKAMIYVDQGIKAKAWAKDVLKAADIHDEWQYRVRTRLVDEFIAMALPCFVRAGEFFDYNIRIDGDAKVGQTWAETH